MGVLQDALAELLAEVEPEFAVPTGDAGYGSDISCTDDVSPDMAEVPGDSPLAVAESLYRRFTTPRGSLPDADLPDAADVGFDVASLLNKPMAPRDVLAAQGAIRAEALKDDRVASVTVAIAQSGSRLDIAVRGEAATGPFSLTLAVTDAGVLLQEMNG